MVDGETAVLLMAKEEDETLLGAELKDFNATITRISAEELAAEVEEEKRRAEEE